MAAIYFLIGIGVLVVSEAPGADDPPMLAFGASAGSLFLLGAILLLGLDRRWVWIAGALLQVLVAVTYAAVAPQRDPPFELWGITLRILQVPLLLSLLWLAFHREPDPNAAGRPGW